jgi:inosine/xanthosine triphosphatase
MKIAVASHNPVKLGAARRAFETCFAGAAVDIVPVDGESDVGAQPFSDEDTRHGAINRAHNAGENAPEASYWVGIEGGVDTFNGQLMTFAWMAVLGPDGRTGVARSLSLPLPPVVKQLVEEGLELGEANDRVFSTANSKQAGGAFGLLTGGRFTREGVYTDALTIALLPFTNPVYLES